jgi:hypothetical protein
MFAFVAVEDDGEGICGFLMPDGKWVPLVGADMERIDALRPIAKEIAEQSGKTIRLIHFSTRRELEVIEP